MLDVSQGLNKLLIFIFVLISGKYFIVQAGDYINKGIEFIFNSVSAVHRGPINAT